MAGENLARLVRDRATTLVRREASDRDRDGDLRVAELLRDLADEIAEIPIGATENG